MGKKIKILTVHHAINYGAVLQAYALSKFIKNKEHDTEIINLCPSWERGGKKRLNPFLWKTYLDFNHFQKRFLPVHGKRINTLEKLYTQELVADCVVVGSDQIWNPDVTKIFWKEFFLNFVPDLIKKVSYAPSFGESTWNFDAEKTANVSKLLRRFDAISVREDSGVTICETTFNIKAIKVLDPTFLLEDYNEILGASTLKEDIQLLSFKFVKNDGYYDLIRFLADETKLKPTDILNFKPIFQKRINWHFSLKVEDWLKSFKFSSFVVTDSFHGVVFSILFKKQFIVFPSNPKRITRIESLLRQLHLYERLFLTYDEVKVDDRWKSEINYNKVYERLDQERQISIKFLLQNL